MWKVFLGFFLVMVFGGGILRGYSTRGWNGLGRFTIIDFRPTETVIESLDPEANDGVRIRLPEELQVKTLEGKGTWQIRAIRELAKKFGWKWASASVANYLGIVYTSDNFNLGWWDKIYWKILSQGRIWTEVPLGESSLVSEEREVDDEKVLGLDNRWESRVREYFSSIELVREQIQVTVINSTRIVGIGARAARLIDSSGIRVVAISSSWPSEEQKCLIVGNKTSLESVSSRYLVNVFGCDTRLQTDGRDTELKLVLGVDYGLFIHGPGNLD